MAATLSLMKFPTLEKQHQQQNHVHAISSKLQNITNNTFCNDKKYKKQTTSITCSKINDTPKLELFTEASIHQHLTSASLPLTSFALPFLLDTKDALAINGEFGLLEGRAMSLIHPLVMGSLFVYTLWAGYLGWQWRRVRTIQNEINELKKQVQPAAVTPQGTPVEPPPPPSPVELKIQQLTEERKELIKGGFRDRHFNAGSILLGFGVFESVGGAVNTWFRTGKLFPGPHLFAGAGITVLWAAAASLVPAMQRGNETARSLHIALNTLNVLLFLWQIPTGIDIVLKVLEFTKWP